MTTSWRPALCFADTYEAGCSQAPGVWLPWNCPDLRLRHVDVLPRSVPEGL